MKSDAMLIMNTLDFYSIEVACTMQGKILWNAPAVRYIV